MNLNKFTKAELISKFKSLETKAKTNENDQSNQTLSSLIITTLINFRKILLKITLVAFLIRTLKKYSLFRRLWSIFNWLVMAIFGFSLMDLYDLLSWNG